MTRLLIDGDVLAHKAAAAGKTEVRWDPDTYSLALNVTQAAARGAELLAEWLRTLGADSAVLAFSDPDRRYFRHRLWPDYKAGRSALLPGWQPLLAALSSKFKVACWRGLEADDVLGILATEEAPEDRIVVSIDKDMGSFPCRLWNPDKPELGVRDVSLQEADRYHLHQTLVGDRTDGYPGCPGIGEVRATAALEADLSWATVVGLYEKAGRTEEDALLQARLARILRDGDYDHRTHEVRLWTPARSSSHA